MFLWCLWIVALGALGYGLAGRALATPEAPTHRRVAAAMVAFVALQHVAFEVLSALGRFDLVGGSVMLAGAGLGAVWMHSQRVVRESLAHDVLALGDAAASLKGRPGAWLVGGAVIGVSVYRLTRGLAVPPLAWDALTYHLALPARWIVEGADRPHWEPDQWGYLNWFPRAGDVVWAWAMRWATSDAPVAPAAMLIWSGVLVGAASAARSLGATRSRALLAGVVVAFIPACVNTSTSAYTDPFVLATLLLAIAPAMGESAAGLAFAGLSLGLHGCAKQSGLPTFAVGAAVFALLHCNIYRRPLGRTLAALMPGAALVLWHTAWRWHLTGSPTWPLPLRLGGRVIFEGNPELAALYAGRLLPLDPERARPLWLVSEVLSARPDEPFDPMRWGFFTPVALGLGVAGLSALWREPARRLVAVGVLLCAAVPMVAVMSSDFAGLRAIWAPNMARLVLALPAALWVLGARAEGRATGWLLGLAATVEVLTSLPTGRGPRVTAAVAAMWPLVVAGCAGVGLVTVLGWRRGRALRGFVVGVVGAAAVLTVPIEGVRRSWRHPLYRDAFEHRLETYELHPNEETYADAAPLWERVDDGPGHRIALTLGWDGVGHNGYRYPFFGRHFQNTVLWVANTRSGAVIDAREADRLAREADYDAWRGRLEALRVEYVAALHPAPLEQRWMAQHPAHFARIAEAGGGRHSLYRVLHP